MRNINSLLLGIGLIFSGVLNAQCYDDACDDDNDIPVPGCCVGTTAGMTWSGYGDVNCVNMYYEGATIGGQIGNPDTWISFTAPTTGFIEITIDNITQDGITQFVVFDHQNAEVCSSLNSFGLLAGEGCNDLPGDGVGGVTSLDTVEYAVEAGERYWVLVSADVENGATAGTFELCVDVVPLPPPPPPAPGQDCVDAQTLCNTSGSGFYVGNLDLGDGLVEEDNLVSSGCIFNEQSSQWYTFTASESGSFEMMLTPDNYTYTAAQGGSHTGDDFDWEVYDLTAGCEGNAVSLACDYAGPVGSTGYSSTGASGWGQVEDTDYHIGNGPGDQNPWNTTTVNFTAGNTYGILIQNYSTSTGGVTVSFQGNSVMAPTSATAEFDAVLTDAGCEAALTLTNTAVPNYTYTWDYGDGTSVTSSNPPDHYYDTPGTYIVEVEVVDALGCTQTFQRIIDVIDCVPLPIELTNFNAELIQNEVVLKWTTASETNNDYFLVERSNDLSNWDAIIEVNGAGNSTEEINYMDYDKRPMSGLSYYRLKQVDYNGEYSYSAVKSVKKSTGSRDILKIVNIHGQEVSNNYKGVVYYMYSDGSTKTVLQ